MKRHLSFFFVLLIITRFSFAQNTATIRGQFSNFRGDTINCLILSEHIVGEKRSLRIPVVEGKFSQHINFNHPIYLSLSDGTNYVYGLLEKGDSVFINLDTSRKEAQVTFEGKGKEKFEIRNALLFARVNRQFMAQVPVAKERKYPLDYMYDYIDSFENVYVNRLKSYQSSMSNESYSMLLDDIRGSFLGNRNNATGYIFGETSETVLKEKKDVLTTKSISILQKIIKFESGHSNSKTYVNTANTILFRDYDNLLLNSEIGNGLFEKYNYMASRLPADLKVPVFTIALENEISKLIPAEEIEAIIKNTYNNPKDGIYKNYITKKFEEARDTVNFRKGVPAPDFVIEDVDGNKISLSTFKGKVIFMDFWFGACLPCHILIEDLKPAISHFSTDSNVVFLYISIDPRDVWKTALAKYKIKGFHAFTENREKDHAIIKSYKVDGYPSICLIDRNGNIFSTNPGRNSEELQQQIEAALR